MAGTTVDDTTVTELMAELAALEDPKARAVNEKRGDDQREEQRAQAAEAVAEEEEHDDSVPSEPASHASMSGSGAVTSTTPDAGLRQAPPGNERNRRRLGSPAVPSET